MATEACCTPAPPAEHLEEGKTTTFGGLDAYVNPGPTNATSAIVFVSDIFGYDPPLLRKLADRSAAEGYFVVVPDLFHGEAFVPVDPASRSAAFQSWAAKHSAIHHLSDPKFMVTAEAFYQKMHTRHMNRGRKEPMKPMKRHKDPYPKSLDVNDNFKATARAGLCRQNLAVLHSTDLTDVKAIIKQLKEQGIKKIGVTGCCWGAKVAVCLAIEDEPLIDAAVLFHPSLVTHDDVRSIKKPVLFLIPEVDQQVPAQKAEEFKNILNSKPEVDCFLKIFPGMKHGWCIRYDVNVPEEVKSAHEAHDDMLEWYKKHMKD